jgi:hypothetical protein
MATAAQAQAPCTDAQARQKPGTVKLDSREQNELNQRTHFKPGPSVLKKIDKTIELLKQALPNLTGVEGNYWHEITDPAQGSHALRFAVKSAYFDYFCAPATAPDRAKAGKIRASEETTTSIEFYFNTLGWLVNERVSLGKELKTTAGETIFLFPWDNGTWKGQRLYARKVQGLPSEAVILTAPGVFPFKPVSREEFLRAREKVQQKYLDEARTKLGPNAPVTRQRERELAELVNYRTSMPQAELQSQAVVREWNGSPAYGRIFTSDPKLGQRLVTVDHKYIDPAMPLSAVQLIVIYWTIEEDNPPKMEAIRKFKDNFDLGELQKLMDR